MILLLMALCGVLLEKGGVLHQKECQGLSRICVYLFAPSMILNAFLAEWTKEQKLGLLFAALCAVAIHALFLLVTALVRKPLKLGGVDQATLILTNAGNIIIPLVAGTIGQRYVVYSAAYLGVQNMITWTYGLRLIGDQREVQLKRIVKSPALIAIAIGVFYVVVPFPIPDIVRRTISDLAACMAPASMILVGIVCADFGWKKLWKIEGLWNILALRLIIYPVLAGAILVSFDRLVQLQEMWQILFVMLLSAAGPGAAMVPQIAQVYQNDVQRASGLNVLTTIFCTVTMPLMTLLIQMVL